jgi:excisionase family DNA binding protein
MQKISIARRRIELKRPTDFGVPLAHQDRGTTSAQAVPSEETSPVDGSRTQFSFPLNHEQSSQFSSLVTSEKEPLLGVLKRENSGVFVLTLKRQQGLCHRLLTAREVSEMLGLSLSSIYRLVKSGRLMAYRINRLLRFDPDCIMDFLSSEGSSK